jgi:hypothetical protein
MKALFLIIIIASISVATITSISFFFNAGNAQHCTICPALSTPGQPLQLRDVITEPQTVSLGDTFLIYANVYNPNPYSVYVNMGCMSSPLSATFDKNVEVKTEVISCPGPSKQEISPNQEARIAGPGPDTIYTATSTGQTNAKITLLYEWNGGSGTVTTTKNFTIEQPASHPSDLLYGQLKLPHPAIIDESKARSLAENSLDELKTTSYGCHFDGVSGIFGTDSNGTSKLEAVRVGYNCNSKYVGGFLVTEDPQLTKIINVTAYPSDRFTKSG